MSTTPGVAVGHATSEMSCGEQTPLLDHRVASPARSLRVFTAVATISVLFLGCVGLIVFGPSERREGFALGVERGDRGNLGVVDHAEAAPLSTDPASGSVRTSQPDETLSAGPRSQPLLSLFMKGDTNNENQQRFNTGAFLDTCQVRPRASEFCVYVNTNDYYYRMSDAMNDAVPPLVMNKIMSDELYKGSILQTLRSDPAFSQMDQEGRFRKLVDEVRARDCEQFRDDTLLLHIRSGDSGWIAKTALGEDEDESVQAVDREEPDLGIIDETAIQGVLAYLQQTPSVKRVVMRTTLHFGVPEREDEGQIDPTELQYLYENYGLSDESLWGSNFLLHDVYSALTGAGYETWLTSHSSADQDTCEYAKACHFLSPDGRGFSQLMTKLNQDLAQC